MANFFVKVGDYNIEEEVLDKLYLNDYIEGHNFGSSLKLYTDQIDKNKNQENAIDQIKKGFLEHFKEYEELGNIEPGFYKKNKEKFDEAQKLRNEHENLQRPQAPKKNGFFDFGFKKREQEYNKSLSEYKNKNIELVKQYSDLENSIIPEFANYKDVTLTPKQEMALQYISSSQDEMFNIQMSNLEKNKIGFNEENRQKINEEIIGKPIMPVGFEQANIHGNAGINKTHYKRYLDNVANEIGYLYDISNPTKDENGKYIFNFNKDSIEGINEAIDSSFDAIDPQKLSPEDIKKYNDYKEGVDLRNNIRLYEEYKEEKYKPDIEANNKFFNILDPKDGYNHMKNHFSTKNDYVEYFEEMLEEDPDYYSEAMLRDEYRRVNKTNEAINEYYDDQIYSDARFDFFIKKNPTKIRRSKLHEDNYDYDPMEDGTERVNKTLEEINDFNEYNTDNDIELLNDWINDFNNENIPFDDDYQNMRAGTLDKDGNFQRIPFSGKRSSPEYALNNWATNTDEFNPSYSYDKIETPEINANNAKVTGLLGWNGQYSLPKNVLYPSNGEPLPNTEQYVDKPKIEINTIPKKISDNSNNNVIIMGWNGKGNSAIPKKEKLNTEVINLVNERDKPRTFKDVIDNSIVKTDNIIEDNKISNENSDSILNIIGGGGTTTNDAELIRPITNPEFYVKNNRAMMTEQEKIELENKRKQSIIDERNKRIDLENFAYEKELKEAQDEIDKRKKYTNTQENTGYTNTQENTGYTNTQENTGYKKEDLEDIENPEIIITIDENGKKKKTVSGKLKTKSNYNYGEDGRNVKTIGEINEALFGEKNNKVLNKSLAYALESTSGGKKYLTDKEIHSDDYIHGKLKVDSQNKDVGNAIGSVLAEKYFNDIVDLNGNIDRKKITEIADKHKQFGGLDAVDSGMERQVKRTVFDNAYGAKEAEFLNRNKALEDEGQKISNILEKIEGNKTLDADEVAAFKEYQKQIDDLRNDMINFAEGLGYTSESVFGEGFRLSQAEKKKRVQNKNLKNLSEVTEGTRSRNFDTKSFNSVNARSKWLDYEVADDGTYTKKSETAKANMKDDLDSVFNLEDQDYKKASDAFGINKDNYMDYLKDNPEALSTDDAKKLYGLKNKGIDIGEGNRVLEGLAVAHSGKLDGDNNAVKKLNSAIDTLSTEGYMNISNDNVERVGSDLTYEDGKYKLRDLNLTDKQRESEKFKKILDSKNIGMENLDDILSADVVNTKLKDSGLDLDQATEKATGAFKNLKDSGKSTGYSIEEQLKNNGIDAKVAAEIAEAKKGGKKIGDLSAEALVGLGTMKELDSYKIDFGKVSADEMKEMIKNQKSFFGVDKEDIDNMSEDDLRKMFGDAFNKNTVDGKLSSGYGLKARGQDVTDAKGFVNFYNNLIGENGDLDWDKVFKSVEATKNGKVNFEDTLNHLKNGGDFKDLRKAHLADDARDFIANMFEKAGSVEGLEDTIGKDELDKIINLGKELKGKNMKDVASNIDIDDITKNVGKMAKIGKEGEGFMKNLKVPKGAGKWVAGAAALGGIAGLGVIANNAAEERERKRQEMQQLMMAQNQSIRGGY